MKGKFLKAPTLLANLIGSSLLVKEADCKMFGGECLYCFLELIEFFNCGPLPKLIKALKVNGLGRIDKK